MHGDPITAIVQFATFVYQTTMAVTIAYMLLDALLGISLLALFHRKRHLWWVLPLANAVVWLTLTRAFANSIVSPPENLWIDVLGLAAGLVASGMVASVLSLTQIAFREVRRRLPEERAGELPERFNRPARNTPYPSFVEGITSPWEGFAFLCYYPALWRYGVFPIVLNIMISMIVLIGLLAAAVVGSIYIYGLFDEGWWWRALEVLLIVIMITAAVGLSLVAWLLLEGILCGYFYSRLARQVELRLGTPAESLSEVSFVYQVVDTFMDVAILISVNAGLLLLHIVPVIGSVAAFIGGWYFNAFWMGLDYFSLPLGLRAQRRREQRAYCRQQKGHTLGLGTAVVLLHLLPIVGSLLLTTAAVGVVLLRRRIELSREGETTRV